MTASIAFSAANSWSVIGISFSSSPTSKSLTVNSSAAEINPDDYPIVSRPMPRLRSANRLEVESTVTLEGLIP
jgi:hypothetical protein